MTELQDLIEKARNVGAVVGCDDECGFQESFADYLERDDRVDEELLTVSWECPACGCDTMRLGHPPVPKAYVFNGIEDFEQTFAE